MSGSPMHSLIIRRVRFGKADVHTVVTLMDNASQGLNEAFSSSFTDGTQRHPKQDLFASSTPSMTGRIYTLIFNGSVKISGTIGLAPSGGPRPISLMAFPGLRAITSPK